MYRYQWSKKFDLMHTISNLTADGPEYLPLAERVAGGFIRQMRPGCPWQIVDEAGAVVASGIGPSAR